MVSTTHGRIFVVFLEPLVVNLINKLFFIIELSEPVIICIMQFKRCGMAGKVSFQYDNNAEGPSKVWVRERAVAAR